MPSDPPSAAMLDAAAKTDEEVPRPSTDPFYDPRRDGLSWHGGRFEVIGRLGSGGMGEVYRVRDRELDEVVALKIIPKESTLELRSTDRLKREVRLARRIASPHVCRIYDIVDLGSGIRGLTMAFVQGTTLSDLMRRGVPVDYKRIARWGADIAEGLHAAHELSIIHRDLKPENVMIGADDRAVILDFGIALSSSEAKANDPTEMKLTQVGMIMGTPLYMSPEQILNMPLDGRSDLFALGLMLAELITGEVPMRGTSYAELLEKRVTKAGTFHIKDIDPGAPLELADIVDSLVKVPTRDRPGSSIEVARMLRAFAESASKPIASPSPQPTAIETSFDPANDGATGSALSPAVPSDVETDKSQQRRLVGLAVVALVLVVLGIMLAESKKRQAAALDAGGDPLVEAIDAGRTAEIIAPPTVLDAGAKDAGPKRGPTKLQPVEQM